MGSKQKTKHSPITISDLSRRFLGQLPAEELDRLLALALNRQLEFIYKNPQKQIPVSAIQTLRHLVFQRKAGYSFAYLKGQKDFFGFSFYVSRHTLIPRPESEMIVEEALKYIANGQKILDVGTGSGALILSIAKSTDKNARYTAVDISAKALKVARTNARKLDLKNKVKFIKSNLLSQVPQQKFDLVVANLPYLTPQQLKEPSIKKEPTLALLSGKDGLSHYKKLFKQLPKYLEDKFLILLEIDPSQKEAIEIIINTNLPTAKIKFLKDLANNIRVVKITN